MPEQELLDEKVIEQRGRLRRIRRWLRGVHPGRGVIIQGLTGLETVEELDCVLPAQVIHVQME